MSSPKSAVVGRIALGLAVASVMPSVALRRPAKVTDRHTRLRPHEGRQSVGNGRSRVGHPPVGGYPARRRRAHRRAGRRGDPDLSTGILTQDEADATAQTNGDPYRTDVNVRPGESLGGPDGGPATPRPALESKDTRAKADTQADMSACGGSEPTGTDRHRLRCESGLARARFLWVARACRLKVLGSGALAVGESSTWRC